MICTWIASIITTMPEASLASRLRTRFRAVFTRRRSGRDEPTLRAPYFLTGQVAAPTGTQRDVTVEMPILHIPIHVSRQALKFDENGTLSGSVDLVPGKRGRMEIWLGHGNKQIYKADIEGSHTWSVSTGTKDMMLIKAASDGVEEVTQLLVLEDGSLQVTAQTVTISSRSMELYDIYGQPLASSHSGSSVDSSDSTKECIACLSNIKDTVVLPCRHMCLCSACAEGVKSRSDRCPLCRQHFTGFLHLGSASLPSIQ